MSGYRGDGKKGPRRVVRLPRNARRAAEVCSGPEEAGLPFAVSKRGDADVPSARRVGAFHGRLGGDLCPHGLHQVLQLGP